MTVESNDITIKIIKNREVSPDLDNDIREGLVECYPKDRELFSRQRAWHSTPEWIVCALTAEGKVAAYVAIVEREITVGEKSIPIKIAGPQGVFVRPPWRKTGLSDRIMETAMAEARSLGLDAGLLFSRKAVADKVYSRMGWKEVKSNVLMEDSDRKKVSRPDHEVAMYLSLSVRQFPEGDINLNGPDF